MRGFDLGWPCTSHVACVTIVVGSNKGRRNNKVERRSRFISSSLSPIWLLRSSGLHGKVGLYSASKRCRRNSYIVTVCAAFSELATRK